MLLVVETALQVLTKRSKNTNYHTPRTPAIGEALRSHVAIPFLLNQGSLEVKNRRKCFILA